MDKLIGNVNTHESKGTDEDGVPTETVARGQDINTMTSDKLTQIMTFFGDPQSQYKAHRDAAGGSWSDMFPCADMSAYHADMVYVPYSNHQAREDQWLVQL